MLIEPNHFIFVVSRLDYGSHILLPEAIFDALTARSLWLLAQHTPHRKRMAPGDHVIFYFAGPKRRHFVADAVIAGEPRPLTQEEARFTQELGLLDFNFALDLTSIRRWKSPAPIAPLYDALTFIKDKRYPGHQLRLGIVRLSDQDYETIMAERT